jgi:hypothetical protein
MKLYVVGANGTIGKIVVDILRKNNIDFEPLYLADSAITSLKLTKGSILINCAYDFKCLPNAHYKKNIALFNKVLTLCQLAGLKLVNISTQLVQSDQKDAYISTKREIETMVTNFNGVNLRVGVLELGTKSDVINRLENIIKLLKFIPSNFQEMTLHLTTYDNFNDNLLRALNNYELFSGPPLNSFDPKSVTLFELLKSRTSIKRKLNVKFVLSFIYLFAIVFEKTFHRIFFVNSLTLGRLISPSKLIRNVSRNAQ